MGHLAGEPYYGIERVDDEEFTVLVPNPNYKPGNGSESASGDETLEERRSDRVEEHVRRHAHHYKHGL